MLRLIFAVGLLLLAGCIKAAPEKPEESPEFDVPADPIVDNMPVELPAVDEPAAPVPDQISSFSGVRVYGDPSTCNPCRYLAADIAWLCENYRWSMSESVTKNADWQLLPARETDQRIPLIEVWRNGRVVEWHLGYVDSEDPAAREAALIELVRLHPRAKR